MSTILEAKKGGPPRSGGRSPQRGPGPADARTDLRSFSAALAVDGVRIIAEISGVSSSKEGAAAGS
ncbi:MAG: hypothetical protein U5K69_28250 [Balneolaceae bacterium]|nr:hypothetical protein [Balneolaceae bacterium]